MPCPEEPEQAPPLPEFVPEPVYPKFMPLKDKILPAEEQPLLAADSPIVDSSRYIPESDPEEDHREDPTDYPADEGDDANDDNGSFDDDDDDDDNVKEDEDEDAKEEHPASADSILSLLVHHVTYSAAMIRMRAETPSTSHPPPPIVLPHTRESMAMLRATGPSTYILVPPSKTLPSGTPPLLPVPLPTSSPPFLLPSRSHRADVPEVTLPPQKRLYIALGLRFEVGESSSTPTARPTGGFKANYSFVATLDDEIRRDHKIEVELGWRMTNFITTVRQDIDEIYVRLDDAQDNRVLMSDASDTTRAKVASLRTTVLAQQSEITGLRAADQTRQTQLVEALTLLRTLQTQVAALQRQREPARGPVHPKAPGEANSSSYILLCLALSYSLLSITGNSRLKMPPKTTTRSTPATTTTTTTTVTDAQLKALIDQGVANALVARDADTMEMAKTVMILEWGTEGVVKLTQWFKRMETVFHISNCTVKNQIKFTTCTLLGSPLTWWNSYVTTVGPDVAYAMTWTNLRKKMTNKYFPMGEIKKLEVE
nr:reverse transcriptase domain-containing protein [Tanacetum cinerariifolium]